MKVKQRLLGFLIAGFIFLPAISTFAGGDFKCYPGFMGVKAWKYGPDPTFSLGRIGNPSTTRDIYVDLPVIHDHMGYSIDVGYVSVNDHSSDSSINCRLISSYRNGSSSSYRTTAYDRSTNSDGTQEYLFFRGGRLGNNAKNRYYYSCFIPRRMPGRQASYIISYFVFEN
jgi:hypothetical protein